MILMLNVTRMPQSTYTVTSVLTVFIKNVSSSLYNGSKKRILKTFIIGYFQVSSPFCQKSVFLEEKPGIKNSYFKKLAHANLKNPIFQKKPAFSTQQRPTVSTLVYSLAHWYPENWWIWQKNTVNLIIIP